MKKLPAVFGGAVIIALTMAVGHAAGGNIVLPGAPAAQAIASVAHVGVSQTLDSAGVQIPWGAWLADHLGGLSAGGVSAWLGILAQRLGVPWLKVIITDAAVERAIGAGLATVQGAVADKRLEVHVANHVARAALIYLVDHEPLVARWLGASIGQRIIAHIGAKGLAPEEAMISPK